MSVLIKGMEIPKSCYVCPYCDYVSARCDAVKGNPYTPESRYEKRADFCPLIPVPPHGDLIDRDKTAKTLAHDYAYAAADMVRNEMPTVIPASKEGEG